MDRRGRSGAGQGDGADAAAAAARALAVLIRPLAFAVAHDFAGAARLAAFGATLRSAVDRAREAGAQDTPALRGLWAEASAFDALAPAGRRSALGRVAAHLAALIPVPREIADVARAARAGAWADPSPQPSPRKRGEGAVEADHPSRGDGFQADRPTPLARAGGEGAGEGGRVAPSPPPPRTPEERARRRAILATRLADLPRAHPAPRAQLEERGRMTVEDALEFWPRAWQDRTRVSRIRDLRPGDEGIALAAVKGVRLQRMRSGRPLLKVAVADETGALDLVFFNPAPWRARQFREGDTILCSGKVTEGFGARRQMTQPEVEKLQAGDSANFGRIVPIYPGPADYQHPALRKLMKRLCDEVAPLAVDDLPASVRTRRRLLGRGDALAQAHFPPPGTDVALAAERATPAFRRLVFEELFFLQLALARRRQGIRAQEGIAFDASPEAVARVQRLVPFPLTASQRKTLGEIARDMARPEPMNRLLQGDVGSGKTAVAFAALMLAVQSGWQAALMVPTEILAEQHARTLARWLEGTGVEVALVGAQARGKGQREARAAVASGRARIAVGTHALLEEAVEFERLGLAVVDEQHRFGVVQRAALIAKGKRPDVLVMTATPIPRTLALAFYGDLDQSKITELPPGRTPVSTRVFGDAQRKKAHEVARAELDAGRQAFVVYPLVAESEKSDLADATGGAAELAKVFAPHAVGLLHGRMKAAEKQAVMDRFRGGALRVLVATTVIEVGVDVPNATVMIVEHAERFGLSQLHQLRGRVGRGAARSHCLLVAHFRRAGDDARERLEAMASTQDGFELARVDLKLRGPGELVGTRQSGQKLLDVADLYRDEAILEEAREDAFALAEADPGLARPENAAVAEALRARWAGRLSLAQVG
ncbi:MAG TPA: ATP-dependent DNA helicase RecG [Anaeromyxobacteraceae bacterium]|nr:ATP-dependent DNA helicase RecG [Anaeromyxobacteraceae bacterium]